LIRVTNTGTGIEEWVARQKYRATMNGHEYVNAPATPFVEIPARGTTQ